MRLPLLGLVAALAATAAASSAVRPHDWPRFGYDTARHGASAETTLTAANVGRLHRNRVTIEGTVDSSPISVGGKIVVTTTYGKTIALTPGGRMLWHFTPPGYATVAGSAQITNATPAASTDGTAVYAAASDGRIRKLRLADGKVLWTTAITRDPTHEKLTSSLNVSRGLVIATTGGYIGDAPPYQGHVVTLSERSGRIAHVWNSLCADRHALLVPKTCASSDSAIWSRNGAAVDPSDGTLVVATGNGPWNGSTDWGDSVLVLSPDASKLLRHWTPTDEQHLNEADIDLGSTSPALLRDGYAVQGGKDGKLRLLQLRSLPGVTATKGGELQTVSTPGGAGLFSEPAVWQGSWVFVADDAGTAAWRLEGGKLVAGWSNAAGGTSPVVAGGLLYVAGNGTVEVYVASTGRRLASLPTGPVHWQSPIVADGHVVVAEGNANDHATTGVLDIFSR